MSDHLIDFDRAGRITASIVAGILRHDDSMSRKKAWRIVTGREPYRPPNADMQRGLDNEDNGVSALEAHFGKLAEPGRFVPHPEIPWLGASPDGFLDGILIEVKCPRVLHNEVPEKYYDQIQTQLECCNAESAYFVSWVENEAVPFIVGVPRNKIWWEENYPILKEFYELYVETDTEPPRSPTRRKQDGIS